MPYPQGILCPTLPKNTHRLQSANSAQLLPFTSVEHHHTKRSTSVPWLGWLCWSGGKLTGYHDPPPLIPPLNWAYGCGKNFKVPKAPNSFLTSLKANFFYAPLFDPTLIEHLGLVNQFHVQFTGPKNFILKQIIHWNKGISLEKWRAASVPGREGEEQHHLSRGSKQLLCWISHPPPSSPHSTLFAAFKNEVHSLPVPPRCATGCLMPNGPQITSSKMSHSPLRPRHPNKLW